MLSCDNLAGNGEVLRAAVLDYARPSTWPGRLGRRRGRVPVVHGRPHHPCDDADDLDDGEQLLGLRDEGVVVTEPFSQWVVEDTFAAGRPAWEPRA